MSLPINDLATIGVELIFSLTTELQKPFTIVINRDVGGTNLAYDPVTRSYPALSTKETELVLDDVRYIKFKPEEIRNSNGTLTPNSRKVYFKYSALNGIDINQADQGKLPDDSVVEITSIRYIPEVNPVFVVLQIEGVNDALSINA